jgi:hypothetical protein
MLLPSRNTEGFSEGTLTGKAPTGLGITSPYVLCEVVTDDVTTNKLDSQPGTVYVLIDSENEPRKVAALDKTSVYNFENVQNDNVYQLTNDKRESTLNTQPSAKTKNKPVGDGGEICFVKAGPHLKQLLNSHPMLRNLYLNRGKRDVKKHLVTPKHLQTAVDTGSWQRGKNIHQRNRLDDLFVYTEAGRSRSDLVKFENQREEYVVNWYLWCPGHGNCLRSCGGYGKCEPGKLVSEIFVFI